jgi:hypothetical protein
LRGARKDFRNGESKEYFMAVNAIGAQITEEERHVIEKQMRQKLRQKKLKKAVA